MRRDGGRRYWRTAISPYRVVENSGEQGRHVPMKRRGRSETAAVHALQARCSGFFLQTECKSRETGVVKGGSGKTIGTGDIVGVGMARLGSAARCSGLLHLAVWSACKDHRGIEDWQKVSENADTVGQ